MRSGVGTAVVVVWLIIGALAAGQRGYFSSDADASCTKLGRTLLTIVAGPLNYVGVNPRTTCETPQPSK
jgi:hypothetical protein